MRLIVLWVLCLAALCLAACGGSGGNAADAEQVDLALTVETDAWKVQLADVPEKHLILGKGNITYQAPNGSSYVIVFIRVTNTSDTLQVIPRDLFRVRDAAGTEYNPTQSALQVAYLEQDGSKEGYTIVLDSPQQPDRERRGVLSFEIPDEATDLALTLKEAERALPLGF